jgi:DNA ligase 1
MLHPEIFKRDSAGKTRTWRMEENELGSFRTIAGIMGGNLVTSEWTLCEPTNVGRSNERDATQQSSFEVGAAYEKKLTREYHRTLDAISGGAHFFKPMLAHKFDGWKGECYAQPKLDGIRCIATKNGLFSREGKPIYGVPHIQESLAEIFQFDDAIILDGELYNHDYREDFGEISSMVRKQNPTAEHLEKSRQYIQYHVYDMPSHLGKFGERSESLNRLLTQTTDLPHIQPVETVHTMTSDELDETYSVWLEEGWEGQMVRLNTPYEQKRSKSLLKRKEMQDAEFECVSIEEGSGNWTGLAKRVVCKLPDGRTFGAGIKGNATRAVELLSETHKVVTVQYFQLSPDGIPRFPVAIKFHGSERTL